MNRLLERHWLGIWLVAFSAMLLSACATMPPGADYPKIASSALANPEETTIGHQIELRARAHPDLSGFRLFASGSDAFKLRVQMANNVQRTLDIRRSPRIPTSKSTFTTRFTTAPRSACCVTPSSR